MALPEVHQLDVDPARGEAVVAYRVPPEAQREFLAHLAEVVGTGGSEIDESALPVWIVGDKIALSRLDGLITALGIVESKPGLLRVKAAGATALGRARARLIERALRAIPGVIEATAVAGPGKILTVRFDPAQVATAEIVRALETLLADSRSIAVGDAIAPVEFGVANTTVGLGTVGELLLPVATPVAAGILVTNKLGVIRDAAVQLSRGKVGVPLFDTALLTCSIVTGQVLAYALTDWSLRYWQQRWRRKLVDRAESLLEETPVLPQMVNRLDQSSGEAGVIPALRLVPGDRVRVRAGESIPADGTVVEGNGLIDESAVNSARFPVRKVAGESVLAGTTLIGGELLVEVERVGAKTAAGTIATTVADVVRAFPREPAFQRKAERMAERTVIPTLATAGVGWAAGDLITVGAILHQDWISGPVLAVPLQTMDHLGTALRSGALLRNGSAQQRLAESDFIVLDGDDPGLATPSLELASLQTRIADADGMLRWAAGAGMFLGDERGLALLATCRDRGLVVRQAELVGVGPDWVEVRRGEHQIRLTEGPASTKGGIGDLSLTIDGQEVGRFGFRLSDRLRAESAIKRFKAAGMQVFVASSRPDAAAGELAARLGADLSGGDLDAAGTVRFLGALQKRGVRPVYVGQLSRDPELAAASHVAISMDARVNQDAPGDVWLLGSRYDSMADLVELSRRYDPAIARASRMATIPNLLCIAGAFGGLLNGITAGIIANIGVLNVDRQLQQTLRPPGPRTPGRWSSARRS
jgi:hypothetical protein